MGTPCIFFDRDGIVNTSPGPGYVEQVADFHLIPAFLDALRIALDRGYEAVIVTNQRGVGRGLMTKETLEAIHAVLRKAITDQGLHLRDIYYCTANDDAHPNRKPNPGMFLDAAEDHQLDLAHSWIVGDSESDITAGRKAGCGHTVLVNDGEEPTEAEYRVATMSELTALFGKLL